MKFDIQKWTVDFLLKLLDEGKINLNPPYQRNPIWTKNAQKDLIHSIKAGAPIPNIFLLKTGDESYDMVDGQQRTRALKLYQTTSEIDLTKDDESFKEGDFLKYAISVIIITEISNGEFIEEFYAKVNSSGLRLNRPETIKGKFFATNFLKLVDELNSNSSFQNLDLIPSSSKKRMMDRDLIEELCSLIMYGITDKKLQVDKMYESDISEIDIVTIREKFISVINIITRLNEIQKIKDTRYRQRNDFYTLFGFIKDNINLSEITLGYFYKILLELEKGIRPTKNACKPLAEYAFNCVTQSNSAKARQGRIEILNSLLLNTEAQPNGNQSEVIKYYKCETMHLYKNDSYYTFDLEILKKAIEQHDVEDY